MTRFALGILISILLSITTFAQVEELELKLNTAIPDSERVYVYRDLAYYLATDSAELALAYAEKGIALAEEIAMLHGVEANYRMMGMTFEFQNKLNEALEAYETCLQLARQGGEVNKVGDIYNLQGIACYYQSDYDQALGYYNQARTYCDSVGYLKGQAIALNNLGIVFRAMHDYLLAAETYRSSIRIKEELQDSAGLAASYTNLGTSLAYLGKVEEAEEALAKSLELYTTIGDTAEIPGVRVNMAVAIAQQGRDKEAIKIFEELLPILDESYGGEYISMLGQFGQSLIRLGEHERAIEVLNLGYNQVKGSDAVENLKGFELSLAEAYTAIGQPELASAHWMNYAQIQDSLFTSEKLRLTEEFKSKFDTEQKEAEIAIKDVQISEGAQTKRILIIAVILAAILMVVSIYAATNTRKNNRALQAQKTIIEESLAEKEVLLREIHHRVKNNLQVISSLLSLQSRSIEDQAASDAVQESRNRVLSMSLIHESLYSRDDLRSIDAASYIKELCHSIMQSYRLDDSRIELITNISPLKIDVDTTIPVGLILNELITNCIKYAFPGDGKGTITIDLHDDDSGVLRMVVADNGIGIDPEIQKNLSKRKSFGMRMINTFAKKLKAQWKVESDGGTKITFEFKP